MKQSSNKGNSITASMIYKTAERYVVMLFQMAVQIVIARLLSPDEYGVVAMMTVFISVSTIFIQNGFNMALVQKKNADSKDYETALSINLIIGISLYILLLLSTNFIADFYHQPLINDYLPVLGLLLVFGAVNSIQIAIANRKMMFRNLFRCNVVSNVLSGILGILSALSGLGVWSLIIQQLSASVILGIMLFLQQHWTPRIGIDRQSAKAMFSFGWKMLVAGLINQIYNQLNHLVIGRKYTSSDLAFYSKGNQFPHFVTSGLDVSIGSVIYSALAKQQDNYTGLHSLMRKTMVMNSYLVFPALAVLAMAAKPLTIILLTEKWLPLVPFMQICCLTCAFHPVASVQMQALAAVGRSDMRLKLELIKKPVGVILLLLAINYGPFGIAVSAAITSIFSLIVGAISCRYIVLYSYRDTISDISPAFFFTLLSMAGMFLGSMIFSNVFAQFIVTSLIGISIYLVLSFTFQPKGFVILKDKLLKRRTE